jgi:type II secretory pathway pseudopilin PulG
MRDKVQGSRFEGKPPSADGEQGFMLLGLIVAIAVILLVLGTAATNIAFSIRREREVESARRANQYVLAIRRFYTKNNRYPGSIQQLLNTNNVRYLRKEYVDPLTGQADYRLIAAGQNKTTVKGFFGEPLQGIASAGLGSAAGLQSSGIGGALGANGQPGTGGAAGGFGSSSGFGGTGGSSGAGGTGTLGAGAGGLGATGTGTTGSTDTSGANAQTSGLGSAAGIASPLGGGSSGPIMGVGSSASGNSILEPNEQTTYQDWEFLYDPRLEKLKQAQALNQGLGSVGAGSLGGQTPGQGGFGQQPGGFGQQPGGFGSSTTTGGAGPTGATPQP